MKLEEYFDIEGNCELKDGVYNVLGSVHLIQDVYKLPFKFGIVTDSFWCYGSNLTSIEGCPEIVGGNFECFNNNLTSLEGCPQSVGGEFWCSYNNLTSLKGAPTQIGDELLCDRYLKSTKEYRQYLIMKKLKK